LQKSIPLTGEIEFRAQLKYHSSFFGNLKENGKKKYKLIPTSLSFIGNILFGKRNREGEI
jgi:hypothetical protein